MCSTPTRVTVRPSGCLNVFTADCRLSLWVRKPMSAGSVVVLRCLVRFRIVLLRPFDERFLVTWSLVEARCEVPQRSRQSDTAGVRGQRTVLPGLGFSEDAGSFASAALVVEHRLPCDELQR